MKKLQFFLLAAVAIVFAACSNDDVVLTDTGTTSTYEGGDGYISLQISMPNQSSTRAANDDFDSGSYTTDEYTVHDATLLLFQGTNESSATFYAAYPLYGLSSTTNSAPANVAETETIVQKIDVADGTNNMYALVVVNKGTLFHITGEGKDAVVKFDSYEFDETTTLAALQSTTAMYLGDASAMSSSSHGFFMTNSPLANLPGGTTDPDDTSVNSGTALTITTLAPVDASKIHGTESAAAKDDPAAIIYVERAVAKVTLAVPDDSDTDDLGIDLSGIDNDDLQTVDITGYALDVTNKYTNFVRNTTYTHGWWSYANQSSNVLSTDKYRFIGTSDVGYYSTDRTADNTAADGYKTSGKRYRTYWAQDPNYSDYDGTDGSTYVSDNFNVFASGSTLTDDNRVDLDDASYCFENTFDIADMYQDLTTRLIVEAEFNGGTSFYTLNRDDKTIYTETTVGAALLEWFLSEFDWETYAALYTSDSTESDKEFTELFTVTVTPDEDSDKNSIATDDCTFTVKWTGVGSWAITWGEGESFQGVVDAAVSDLNDELTVSYYADGICYYPVLIKHFGDDLAYWSSEDVRAAGSINDSYPTGLYSATATAEDNWLGRYGVLRNNWYELTIKSISALGTPTIPDVTHKQDDEMIAYCYCQIKILSWAMRKQDVDL